MEEEHSRCATEGMIDAFDPGCKQISIANPGYVLQQSQVLGYLGIIDLRFVSMATLVKRWAKVWAAFQAFHCPAADAILHASEKGVNLPPTQLVAWHLKVLSFIGAKLEQPFDGLLQQLCSHSLGTAQY